MAGEESQPLLNDQPPTSPRQSQSPGKQRLASADSESPFRLTSESTPLLIRRDDDLTVYGTTGSRSPSPSVQEDDSSDGDLKPRKSIWWPALCISLTLTAVVGILVFAFVAPAVVREYADKAAVFTPRNISVETATADGFQTRIEGDVVFDATRVEKRSVRTLGRLVTWIGREVEADPSDAQVYLPEYGNILIGTASLPSIKLNVRNKHVNRVDFLAELVAGDIQGIRAVGMDWLEGRLGRLSIKGKTQLHMKSGIWGLGEHILAKSIVLEEEDFPSIPKIDILKFNVHDGAEELAGVARAMEVDVSVAAQIDSPVSLRIPPLGFEVLVPNCSPDDPYLSLASVTTGEFPINPGHTTFVDVNGVIRGLSDELVKTCPGEKSSPLDLLVRSYMNGLQTTVYVRGAEEPTRGTPDWVVDIMKSVTVPMSFMGHALDNLVRNFTMSDVHFTMPDPFAEPDSPESQPAISALVKVLVGVPKEIDLHVDVPRVRAMADVFYHGDKLGVLKLPEWQPANSTTVPDVDGSPALFVEFAMKDAPLEVTDGDVLTDVIQALLFEGKNIQLHVAATVDAEIATGLGKFAIRGIPADGEVPVKPLTGGSIHHLNPRVDALKLGPTTESSLVLQTRINVTNPTPYAALVPLADFIVLYNATKVAHLVTRDVSIVPGENSGLSVDLEWRPLDLDGPRGVSAGRELLSRYISGSNTSVTVQCHEQTIPGLPRLGKALSRLSFEALIPKLPVRRTPGHHPGGDENMRFIQDATFHLLTSTAEFTLSSPFPNTTFEITSINAKALYPKNEVVGRIDYGSPFPVPPGASKSPRLPVELDVGGIGYDGLKKALGGSLRLDAVASVGVRIDEFRETVVYRGKGITSNVRL